MESLLGVSLCLKPGMNGYQTYKNIRELLPNQKALITNGFSESLDVKQAQKIGAGAYVKKPYTLMDLAN